MRIVLDTNVLVSALLRPGSKPAAVLARCLEGRDSVLLDARILREYRAVLARPKFLIPPEVAAAVLDQLIAGGEAVEVQPWPGKLPDPGDRPFLEVARSGRADALVTGNIRHYPRELLPGTRLLTPSEFLA